MYILRNWYLTMHEDVVIGHGACFGNPKFPEGLPVHTSSILKGENDPDKNELRLSTKSGSCYHLAYAEINGSLLTDTRVAAGALGISLDVGKCAECRINRDGLVSKGEVNLFVGLLASECDADLMDSH